MKIKHEITVAGSESYFLFALFRAHEKNYVPTE